MSALPQRFWDKVAVAASGCWEWTGSKTRGYGHYTHQGKNRRAHRVSYEAVHGAVPEGLELDHLCRNRSCVNPDHLEAVTRQVNLLRSSSFVALHAQKTNCPSGHPYSDENTYMHRGNRKCRTCRAAANEQRVSSRRAQELQDDPDDPRHGTVTGYASYGCRCDRCREARRLYKAARRATAKTA